jgi:hypothetical protein
MTCALLTTQLREARAQGPFVQLAGLFSRKDAAPTSSPPAQDFISGSIRVLRRARAQAQFSCEFSTLCFEGHIFLLDESKKHTLI